MSSHFHKFNAAELAPQGAGLWLLL